MGRFLRPGRLSGHDELGAAAIRHPDPGVVVAPGLARRPGPSVTGRARPVGGVGGAALPLAELRRADHPDGLRRPGAWAGGVPAALLAEQFEAPLRAPCGSACAAGSARRPARRRRETRRTQRDDQRRPDAMRAGRRGSRSRRGRTVGPPSRPKATRPGCDDSFLPGDRRLRTWTPPNPTSVIRLARGRRRSRCGGEFPFDTVLRARFIRRQESCPITSDRQGTCKGVLVHLLLEPTGDARLAPGRARELHSEKSPCLALTSLARASPGGLDDQSTMTAREPFSPAGLDSPGASLSRHSSGAHGL